MHFPAGSRYYPSYDYGSLGYTRGPKCAMWAGAASASTNVTEGPTDLHVMLRGPRLFQLDGRTGQIPSSPNTTEVRRMPEVSKLDLDLLSRIRENVTRFTSEAALAHDRQGLLVLDVAPQDHEGARPYFKEATVESLDIDAEAGATYTADICFTNDIIVPSSRFDVIVCTEVLEHTLQPFDAVAEIERMLAPEGLVFVSTPFNFRIHGPLPDCWRFTEHGLRQLFRRFDIINLSALEMEERPLMPIQYTLIARRRGGGVDS